MKKWSKMGTLVVLLLLAVMGCSKKEQEVLPEDRILMVNDILYYGTEETGPMGDAGSVEGKILSTTEGGSHSGGKRPVQFRRSGESLYL